MSQIMGDHSKRISCLKENVLENLNRLFERWKLTQKSWTLLDKVLKEEYSDSLLEMLNILNGALLEAHRWLISNLESVSSSTQLCEQVSTNFDFQCNETFCKRYEK